MIFKALLDFNRDHKLAKFLPFEISVELSKRCPYANRTPGLIQCKASNKGYGCQPTSLCIFVINTNDDDKINMGGDDIHECISEKGK